MKAFIVFAAVLACAYAKPQIIYNGLNAYGLGLGAVQYTAGVPLTYTAAAPAITYAAAPAVIAPAFTKTQYHAQDELGQASYGYAHPGQAHAAVRDAFGGVRGSYSYAAPDGRILTTNYVADAVNGFRVESNALPVAPAVPEVPALVGPAPVQDTPEVVEARAAHAKAIEEAQARNAEADKQDAAEGQAPQEQPQSRRKRSLVAVSSPLVQSVPAVTYAASPYLHSTVLGANTLTYAAAPAVTYAAAPAFTYAAAPAVIAAPTVLATQAVRQATLTKVVNTPGHAVSYRVD
jgi:hypothetical protein